jgi:hypothetical protein
VPADAEEADVFGYSIVSSDVATLVGTALVSKAYAYTRVLGSACESGAQCTSGFCVEAVCCDQACESGCMSCLGAMTPHGGPDGECGPIAAEAEPRSPDYCPVSPDICETSGACDGRGGCQVGRRGIECREARCTDGNTSVAVSHCDGAGACQPGKSQTCAPGYACESLSAVCNTECTDDTACDQVAGYYCYEAQCVRGARCSADGLLAIDEDGASMKCTVALCSGGKCVETCEHTSDCVGDLVCVHGRCAAESALMSEAMAPTPSCASASHGPTTGSPVGVLVGLLALACGLQRSALGSRRSVRVKGRRP